MTRDAGLLQQLLAQPAQAEGAAIRCAQCVRPRAAPGRIACWLALFSFTVNAALENFLCMNFAPVAGVTEAVFGVDEQGVSWLYSASILATIPLLFAAAEFWPSYPCTVQLVSVLLAALAAWCRWLAFLVGSYGLAFLSAALNGASASTTLVAPALLARWYLEEELRSLGTGIMCQSMYFGWLLGAYLVPLVVTDGPSMGNFMGAQAAAALVNLALYLALFRRPPQVTHREGGPCTGTLLPGVQQAGHSQLRALLACPQYWTRIMSFSVLGGVSFAIPGVQDIVLKDDLGLSDRESSWLNSGFIASGVVFGVALGAATTGPRARRLWLKALFLVTGVAVTGLGLLTRHAGALGLPRPWLLAALAACNVLAGAASLGFLGPAYEAMAEFPIDESYSAGSVQVLLQFWGAALTQVATGKDGFMLLVAVTWAAVLLFVVGHRPLPGAA